MWGQIKIRPWFIFFKGRSLGGRAFGLDLSSSIEDKSEQMLSDIDCVANLSGFKTEILP